MADPAETNSPRAGQLTAEVVRAIRRIIRAIDHRSRMLVSEYGLTGPQLVVLRQLAGCDGEPLSIGRLSREIHLSQATVTGIVDRLAARGLLVRQRSEADRRRILLTLTDEGRRIVAQAPPLLQEGFTRRFGALADWEQTQILSSLQRLVAMMEAHDLDATPMLTTGPIAAGPEETETFLTPGSPPAAGAHPPPSVPTAPQGA